MTTRLPIPVYLEIGKKKVFASAIDWPGWSRSAKDIGTALESLTLYAPRYAKVVEATFAFVPPQRPNFEIKETLTGNSTTDFGAPDAVSHADQRSIDEQESKRLRAILELCWTAFDSVVVTAAGMPLRKGPRGGGREVDGVVAHVIEGDRSYLVRLGGKFVGSNVDSAIGDLRTTMLETFTKSAKGEIAKMGPRGGVRWPPRFFVRRSAWHVLDHAWEIEDRLQ